MEEDIGCLPEADQPASYLGSASHDLNGAECVPWNTAVTGKWCRRCAGQRSGASARIGKYYRKFAGVEKWCSRQLGTVTQRF